MVWFLPNPGMLKVVLERINKERSITNMANCVWKIVIKFCIVDGRSNPGHNQTYTVELTWVRQVWVIIDRGGSLDFMQGQMPVWYRASQIIVIRIHPFVLGTVLHQQKMLHILKCKITESQICGVWTVESFDMIYDNCSLAWINSITVAVTTVVLNTMAVWGKCHCVLIRPHILNGPSKM